MSESLAWYVEGDDGQAHLVREMTLEELVAEARQKEKRDESTNSGESVRWQRPADAE